MKSFFSAARKFCSLPVRKIPKGRSLWHFQTISAIADGSSSEISNNWNFHIETAPSWNFHIETAPSWNMRTEVHL